MTPSNINLSLIQEWHENINKEICPRTSKAYATKTKNKWHSTLTEFLQYLKSKGLIELNYAKVIGQFKDPKINKNQVKKIKYQTLEQFNLFIENVADDFWRTFFEFAFWHGCRIGEQRALKVRDIDFIHESIHFHNTFTKDENEHETLGPIKNGKERTIYLSKQSKDNLLKLVNMYKNMDNYSDDWFLFGGPYNTYKNRIERKLEQYYTELITKNPTFKMIKLTHHEFGRHSHASYLLDMGVKKGIELSELYIIIAQRLGDTAEVIRRTYAHPYEQANNDKARILLNS